MSLAELLAEAALAEATLAELPQLVDVKKPVMRPGFLLLSISCSSFWFSFFCFFCFFLVEGGEAAAAEDAEDEAAEDEVAAATAVTKKIGTCYVCGGGWGAEIRCHLLL